MSRDASGTYTAPSNSFNPAVEGATIDEGDWNRTLDDIEAALTDSLSVSGKGKITAHIDFDETTVSSPAANVGRLYSKDVGGVTSLFFKDNSGTDTNLLLSSPGIAYTFSTSTTMADPGSGVLRFNNATISSVTAIAIDDNDANGADLSTYVLTWDDNGTSDRGTLLIQNRTSPGNVAIFTISGASTDNSGWTELAVTYVTHAGSFSTAAPLGVTFLKPGSAGAAGATGAAGPNVGLDYTWSTSTSGDPGSGKVLVNNATPASATQINISETNRQSASQAAYIATWDASTTTSARAVVRILDVSNPGTITNGATIAVMHFRTGNAGAGAGDVVGPAASVDSEIALFSSTTGKLLKRASTTGILKGTSGVLSAATADTDYTANAFKTIAVSGQSDVVADSAADTLTLAAGSNVTITTNAGTDTITIAAAAPSSIPQNVGLAVSASASALTIALKGADGNDPSASNIVNLPFRSATGTTGTETAVQVTAATSLVISSGSTLGVTSSTAFRIWVVAFNDAGTIRLGAVNCVTMTSSRPTSILGLIDDSLGSSTAEGGAGAADSSGVIYTGTAVTSKAYRILGYVEWNTSGLTAGTWTTTNLATVQVWSPGIPAPGMPTGNRASVVKTDTFTSTTTGAYTDITGFSVSITPKSACNMVRAIGVWNNIAGASNIAATQLVRGSTAIDVGDAWTGIQATSTIFRTSDAVSINNNSCDYLDTPASTSSTTYKVQFYLQGDTFYFNRSITSSASPQPRTSSTLAVEEIMG